MRDSSAVNYPASHSSIPERFQALGDFRDDPRGDIDHESLIGTIIARIDVGTSQHLQVTCDG